MDPLDRGTKPVRGPRDERRMERSRHTQAHGAARPLLLGLGAALADGVVLAGNDDLARAVVVCGPHVCDRAAQTLDNLVREPEDGRHRARPLLHRFRHRDPALPYEPDRVGRVERLGRSERGELADGMADHVVGHDPTRADRLVDREARRDERRLLQPRVEHVLHGAVEADLLEVEPGGYAAGLVDGHRLRHSLGDVASHPGLV